VRRDLARGYISAQTAAETYGMTPQGIADVQAAVLLGKDI
jgi:N-methylhydantoinase B